jgi:Cu-processing system permease protein
MAAVGLLVSVSSRSAAQSQGAGISLWFAFVLLYDLILMGSLAVNGMSVEFLSAALLANPVDAARVLGVLSLEPDLYLLGPAGAYLAAQFSRGGATALLLGALAFWAIAPFVLAVVRFRLRTPRVRRSVRVQSIVSSGEVKVS